MASYDSFSNDGDDDIYAAANSLPPQHDDSYSNFAGVEEEPKMDRTDSEDPIDLSFDNHHHTPPTSGYDDGFPNEDDVLTNHFHVSRVVEVDSFPQTPELYDEPNTESMFSSVPDLNGNGMGYDIGEEIDGGFNDGPVLPPPTDMEPEEGVVLREWRR